jgi:hypothetical protein
MGSGELLRQQLERALPRRRRRQLQQRAPGVADAECDLRMGGGDALDLRHAVTELGRFCAQELAPCRRLEEEVGHLHAGADAAGGGGDATASAFSLDLEGAVGLRGARGDGHGGDRRDRGERLATKAERRDRLEFLPACRSCSLRDAPARAATRRARCRRHHR